jgi:WD40 repeat protein
VSALAVLADRGWPAAAATAKFLANGQDGRAYCALTAQPNSLAGGVGGWCLASGGEDGTIKLWQEDGTGEPVVLSHGSLVRTLTVLPDGRLASGGEDGVIKLWLVDEQKLLAALCLLAGRRLSKDEWAGYLGTDIWGQPSCHTSRLDSIQIGGMEKKLANETSNRATMQEPANPRRPSAGARAPGTRCCRHGLPSIALGNSVAYNVAN